MTRLGIYLLKRSINKAEISRRTGLARSRISDLTLSDTSHLRVSELYLIAKAMNVDPVELFIYICEEIN